MKMALQLAAILDGKVAVEVLGKRGKDLSAAWIWHCTVSLVALRVADQLVAAE